MDDLRASIKNAGPMSPRIGTFRISGKMSDLSPPSDPKRTSLRSNSPIAIYECTQERPDRNCKFAIAICKFAAIVHRAMSGIAASAIEL